MRELVCQLVPVLGNEARCICFVVTGDVVNVIMCNWVGILGKNKNRKPRKNNKKPNKKPVEICFFLEPKAVDSS